MALVGSRKRAYDASTPAFEDDSGYFGSSLKSPKTNEDSVPFKRYQETEFRKPAELPSEYVFKKPSMDPLFTVKKRLFAETPEQVKETDICMSPNYLSPLISLSKLAMKEVVSEAASPVKYERSVDYPFCSPIKSSPNKFWNRRILSGSPFKFPERNVFRKKEMWGARFNLPSPSVDIVRRLAKMNCSPVLSKILANLPNPDLQSASCVSRTWRKVVLDHLKENSRRVAYLKKKRESSVGIFKENKFRNEDILPKRPESTLVDITNEVPITNGLIASATSLTKFDSYLEATKTLQHNEKLMKCPKCQFPAKSKDGKMSECTRQLCLHMFCVECLGPYFRHHICPLSSENRLPKVVIGSRKSKKNLRRL